MKIFFYSWVVSFCLLIAIDACWLSLMAARFYHVHLGYIFAENFNYGVAVIFYIFYAFGLSYLVIFPHLAKNAPLMEVLFGGFVFGLIAYGTYDLTNHVTIKNWPAIVTCVDMAWGAVLSSLVSVLTYAILKRGLA